MQSLITIIIIIECQPFARKISNKINLVREIVMLFVNIQLIVVDQYQLSVRNRLNIGWNIIAMMCLVISINIILLTFDAMVIWKRNAIKLFNSIKKYIRYFKEKKESQVITQVRRSRSPKRRRIDL